jgi:uncharacterized protein
VKRRFFLIMIVLSIIICAFPALALDTDLKVYDYADLFDDDKEELLMEKAQKLAKKRRMDVVIVTVDDTRGKKARDFADDFFDYNGFGYGRDRDGILLLIDISDRIAWISTSGEAIDIFTDDRLAFRARGRVLFPFHGPYQALSRPDHPPDHEGADKRQAG